MPVPSITELNLLKALWRQQPLSTREIHGHVEEELGWFVGWTVKDGRTVVFARLLQLPVQPNNYAGAQTRDAFLGELARRAL